MDEFLDSTIPMNSMTSQEMFCRMQSTCILQIFHYSVFRELQTFASINILKVDLCQVMYDSIHHSHGQHYGYPHATVLLYLNEDYEGGEFTVATKRMKPKKGLL